MKGALSDVTILELGQYISGPYASMLLAAFGADVIKIEPPGRGDPIRNWREMEDDTSLWWFNIARNKKIVAVDLRTPAGQAVVRDLVRAGTDAVIENFRPGTLEKWNLGPADLARIDPALIFTRISGWGQSGPYAHRPGFAAVAEAAAGLRYLTAEPGRRSVRSALSLGDTLAGMNAAFGTLLSLYARKSGVAAGQIVDTAISEAVLQMLEGSITAFDAAGAVRQPSGTRLEGIAPSGTFLTGDGREIVIAGNGDAIFERLMRLMGREDLAADGRLQGNQGRVAHADEIETAISNFTASKSYAVLAEMLEGAAVPFGPINSIREIAADPHFDCRAAFDQVRLPSGKQARLPAIFPKLSETPSETRWIGRSRGNDTRTILKDRLGYDDQKISDLEEDGVIECC